MGSILKVRDKDGKIRDILALQGEPGVGIADITCDGSTESGGINLVNIKMTDGSGYVFFILNGKDGAPGGKGDPGVSPTVNVSKSGKVTTVDIITKDTSEIATINDGEDGYTPIKGIDYFTEDDISDIKSQLINDGGFATEERVNELISNAITATMEASY